MRAWNKPDEIRERYLGEIAPLIAAARQVESLSPVQKKKVRRRIARTLFGTRSVSLHARWVPLLTALAFLAIGGAAFATAQRLGLLPRLGHQAASAPAGESTQEAPRRKAARGRAGSLPALDQVAQVAVASSVAGLPSEQAAVVLPEVPDPLLYPLSPISPASTWVWAPLPESRNSSPAVAAASLPKAPDAPAISPKAARRPAGQLAMAAPWPAPGRNVAAVEAPALAPAAAYPAPRGEAPLPERVAPGLALAAAPASAAPAPTPAPVAAPAAAVAPVPAVVPAPPVAQPAPKPLLGDQALFGQALRKLRSDNDPAAALTALREHGKAYPKSALAGERTALEVEALLALHQDRDALAVLDSMVLDELPRSGERFVVRGELRAAARRWQEASTDFDRALARVSGSPAWHERALWGRGVARLRLGERESGMADIERYRDAYPRGRFAAEAAKFFPKK
jgi:hypothetical protein